MKAELLTQIDVSLSVPVLVQASDGKTAERSKLTLRRPKTRHAKKLATLIGADVLEIMLGDGKMPDVSSIDGKTLVADVLRKLLTEDRLDGLSALIADLCDEQVSTIDDVDLIDLPALATSFAGFFPALRSAMSGPSSSTSPQPGATASRS